MSQSKPLPPAVEIKNLRKTFKGNSVALDGISLTIAKGEMVALIGASGSGKSTLIRHISGLILSDQDGGQITISGKILQANGKLDKGARDARKNIGVVFQQFNLVNRLSVMTNVLIGFLGQMGTLRGLSGRFNFDEKVAAMRALKRVGIEHRATQRASTLSGGQQQRAAIARALVQGADILLADEPIASLDPSSAKKVMNTLARINEDDNITVIVSLHQVEYARYFCPRTIALKAGKVAYDGPSEALDNAFLKELYGDASEELILPEGHKPAAKQQQQQERAGQPALAAKLEAHA